MATGLVPLGDDDVDARLGVVAGVAGAPGEGGDEDALVVGAGDDVRGRGAEGVGEEFDRIVEGHVELAAGDLFHPAGDTPAGGLALGEFGHAVLGEGGADERPVLLRDHGLDVGLGQCLSSRGGFDLLGGHHDVEAVGQAVGVLLHPVEVAGEVVRGGVAHRAEDSNPCGSGERGGHRGEGREAEDGVLDPQGATQLRLHGRQDAAAARRREEVF